MAYDSQLLALILQQMRVSIATQELLNDVVGYMGLSLSVSPMMDEQEKKDRLTKLTNELAQGTKELRELANLVSNYVAGSEPK
jgi:hypothetical protein